MEGSDVIVQADGLGSPMHVHPPLTTGEYLREGVLIAAACLVFLIVLVAVLGLGTIMTLVGWFSLDDDGALYGVAAVTIFQAVLYGSILRHSATKDERKSPTERVSYVVLGTGLAAGAGAVLSLIIGAATDAAEGRAPRVVGMALQTSFTVACLAYWKMHASDYVDSTYFRHDAHSL